MSFLSKTLVIISILQLIHSGYSTYEFNQVIKQLNLKKTLTISTSASNYNTFASSLPMDIQYEALFALFLFTIGIFFSFETVSYIPLSSKKVVQTAEYLQPIDMNRASILDNLQEIDPYGGINNTPMLTDLLQKRREYREWAKKNGLGDDISDDKDQVVKIVNGTSDSKQFDKALDVATKAVTERDNIKNNSTKTKRGNKK
ncbi:uncharacterized protein SCODWIG_01899 [Saccharomycodes ludwigii]|uniref:ER membrane protein complex subunit 5 n=1 Tax=Saccharomycodes ludwigii TaxID=36035 RepID=A0A376B619_9ASCO|nr:hypothetical protein SCDLUD_002452 [Saccharomycodes ludwigii]KAH3900987.1 hypothetical protein SCDLUD_002452 [Saccharomycodes ludwigii]SSD60138.1 uncharacterized protein SCODWIG_01899 [Saccharomycodes ludwigii]